MNTKLRTALAVVVFSSVALTDFTFRAAAPPRPLDRRDFAVLAGSGAPIGQGFGDRQNSWAWSMQWFKGRLFVGTNRAWRCFEVLANIRAGLGGVYPPADPDVSCAPDPADLPLAAEIWAWTPGTGQWDRVYQSPVDLAYPYRPGRWLPRDTGYRGMSVFVEPDGTEALYVSGVTAAPMLGAAGANLPPPRLLRSVDGVSFAPVPQDPGTVFGSIEDSCLRGQVAFQSKFYVTTCELQGGEALYESPDPKLGNDSFRRVTPDGMKVFEVAAYSGRLYVGTQDAQNGYAVLSTNALGDVPYAFQTVVPAGAYLTVDPNTDVLSMHEFKGRLYVGSNGLPNYTGSELIRINPGNTFDLVVGKARSGPSGLKAPLSGLGAGFGNDLNQHIWRMTTHDERLYAGTLDASGLWKNYQPAVPTLANVYGFDVMQSADGWYYGPVTRSGFGDPFSIGARTLASTPSGLAIGSANSYYGLQVFLGVRRPGVPNAPERLEIDSSNGTHVLSWIPSAGAARYHVLRGHRQQMALPSPGGTIEAGVPEPFEERAIVAGNVFVDTPPVAGDTYLYLVYAEDAAGVASTVSNVVQAPSAGVPMTLSSIETMVFGIAISKSAPLWSVLQLLDWTADVRNALAVGDIATAIQRTQQLRGLMAVSDMAGPLLESDLEIVSAKFLRRLYLAQGGLIQPSQL